MSGELVLIVDDHPPNAVLAEHLLVEAGFSVLTAFDADSALMEIAARPPHLILMDLQLPGVDGLELTRRLKADRSTSHIVIIAVTSYAMAGDEDRARAAGCDGYLSKPIDCASFAASVQSCFERASAHVMAEGGQR